MIIERNDLEWRFDLRPDERLPIADRFDLRVIDRNHSSLTAASLQDLGLWRTTGIEGGYSRWEEKVSRPT
ncbi:hypothetical protein M422DRAFT_257565 [Sphaerobolus stellatus SS14]|uniref:Uncharacterized protein n=1 Tax=Sphaerobolus stellatus (strain SS14) TaxID=990650 RepID=A0A0C9VPF4_SPHS4|nr:hypothetical protein M422DRAFT_257565 [Sphaerobolus stellatus SS14]